jgi:hypothetical protein
MKNWLEWNRKTKIAVAALALVVLGFAYQPTKKRIFDWRFDVTVHEATAAIVARDPQTAKSKFLIAWQLSEKSTSQLKRLYDVAKRLGHAERQMVARSLLQSKSVTEADATMLLESALKSGDLKEFENLYAEVAAPTRQSIPIRRARIQFLAAISQHETAVKEARELANHSQDLRNQIFLIDIILLNASKNSDLEVEAATFIRRLMASENKDVALNAFRRLAVLKTPLNYVRAAELDRWLDQRGEMLVKERLFVRSLQLEELFESERSAFLDRVIQEFVTKDPETLSGWLVNNNALDKIGQLPESIRKNQLVPHSAYLESLLQKADYEAAEKWMKELPNGANMVLAEAIQAGIAFKLHKNKDVFYHTDRAFNQAGFENTYAGFKTILSVAERFGDRKSARRAAEMISHFSPTSLPDSKELGFFNQYLGDDAKLMLQIYEKLYASRPSDDEVARQYAMLLIVNHCYPNLVESITETLLQKHPADSSVICIKALAKFSERNDAEAAIEIIKSNGLNEEKVKDNNSIAIYSTILRKAGEEESAKRLAARVNWQLVPEYLRAHLKI